ncbi:MAG: hypothetical protein BWK77_04225 [Verrucomicrobia bacterium A1]|nr:MAG: hypothetical protein BWK77_04225 [Verrucomicrobia bacterium A1]
MTTLNAGEARVLGCLLEKQMTTPEYYPMTLNALVAACNQKNNRQPWMALDETAAVVAVDGLRDKRLAAMVSEAGARVPKYRHTAAETLALDTPQLALLAELLLRGPQTAAELRTRAGRMHAFTDATPVPAILDALAARPEEPPVVKLPRQPGTKEGRYAHLLSGPPVMPAADAPSPAPAEPARLEVLAENGRVAHLEQEVATLRSEVVSLRQEFAEFRRQFQ